MGFEKGVRYNEMSAMKCPLNQICYLNVGGGPEVILTNRYKGEVGWGWSIKRQIEHYVMAERSLKSFLIFSVDEINEV